ncbi:MAG: hypothetical protein K6T87_16065 [Roseiflexus sp.]|uniref:hypothetical protein n=1 Tax=Roseiflexus sp. TaxID=2562120 RepID=UPI0025ECB6AA|nr:hypothetical protein [Roseiflexus sp.]MCL6542072.1 hypothetical protein [Roseiflexus sp.]
MKVITDFTPAEVELIESFTMLDKSIAVLKLTVGGIEYWGVVNQFTGKSFDAFNREHAFDIFKACLEYVQTYYSGEKNLC